MSEQANRYYCATSEEPVVADPANLWTRVDSVTSLVAHRHARHLPSDVRDELLAVSAECRRLADLLGDRDMLAVAVAERWWPNRYVGDLSGADWERVYRAVDGGEG